MIEPKTKLRPGKLLISPPLLWDRNFRQAVVLLCEHSDAGSFGLILNRSLTLALEHLFEDLGDFEDGLLWGGPVQPDTLHFLHRLPDMIPGSISLGADLHWGGDFDVVRGHMRSGLISSSDIRFFLGYSGWSPGQLELEVSGGGWILGSSTQQDVFDTGEDGVWRQALSRKGGTFEVLASMPKYPSLN